MLGFRGVDEFRPCRQGWAAEGGAEPAAVAEDASNVGMAGDRPEVAAEPALGPMDRIGLAQPGPDGVWVALGKELRVRKVEVVLFHSGNLPAARQ